MSDNALEKFVALALGPVDDSIEPTPSSLIPFYANAYKKEELWEPTHSR